MHRDDQSRSTDLQAAISSLFDTSPDAIISVDAHGRIVDFNAAAERLFGVRRQEMKGELVAALVPADLRRQHVEGLSRAAATGTSRLAGRTVETRGLRSDGSEVPIELAIVKAPDDYPARFIAYIRNIADRKTAEIALAKSEKRYRDFVENAVYGIFRSTADGRFVSVNRALVEMLGYQTEAELLRLNLARDVYASPDDRQRVLREHAGAVVETDWKRKDGSLITVRLKGRIVDVPEGPFYDVVVEDITQRRSLETQLAAIQRVETLGRFAGGIAHDFNNILTVIIGFSQSLLDDEGLEGLHRTDVQQISRAAGRAADLTRQILAFSRKQILQPVNVDLNQVLVETRALLRRIITENIALEMTLCDSPALINADPGQIEQVVINLAVNARDAMPTGGVLRISTSIVTLTDADVARRLASAPGQHVRLSVTDTGIGMAPDVVSRVFEPFFTTKPRDRGTGLGLSTAYGIVKQSGGSIWASSEVGVGSTFDIYFPAISGKPTIVAEAPAATPATAGGETVLLVEDDAGVRLLSSEILKRLGYRVLVASDESEALRLAADATQNIDLLLTDVVLPSMGGAELARSIKASRPHLAVLFMSGYSEDLIAHHGVLEHGTLLLQKPFTRVALAGRVREALDSRK
jgi:PAS domain S-box-containing protein